MSGIFGTMKSVAGAQGCRQVRRPSIDHQRHLAWQAPGLDAGGKLMKAGRKRKASVVRTKTGQISRAGKDPRMTALAQHHRAGSLSEWRGTTVGRLLEDTPVLSRGCVPKELHEAANRFAKAYEGYRSAMCSRRPLAIVSGGMPREEDQERTEKLIKRYTDANTVLQQQGHAIRQATHEIVCDHHEENWRPPFHMSYHCVEGLKALADHYGLDWRADDRMAA